MNLFGGLNWFRPQAKRIEPTNTAEPEPKTEATLSSAQLPSFTAPLVTSTWAEECFANLNRLSDIAESQSDPNLRYGVEVLDRLICHALATRYRHEVVQEPEKAEYQPPKRSVVFRELVTIMEDATGYPSMPVTIDISRIPLNKREIYTPSAISDGQETLEQIDDELDAERQKQMLLGNLLRLAFHIENDGNVSRTTEEYRNRVSALVFDYVQLMRADGREPGSYIRVLKSAAFLSAHEKPDINQARGRWHQAIFGTVIEGIHKDDWDRPFEDGDNESWE